MTRQERRASPRFPAKPGSHVIYVEGSGGIRDLSLEGVFVLDSEPLSVGTTLRFSLRLGSKILDLQGIVRRSVPNEGMAIQFTEISLEAKRHLRLYIASL
jgi:hypothetical protein